MLRAKSSSDPNFAVHLLLHFFSEKELTRKYVNINGVGSKGNKKKFKPLDAKRMLKIRRIFFNWVHIAEEQQNTYWKKTVVAALNKKLFDLKKRRKHK